jgi:sugar phosphate isomerase/epimerase
MNVGFLTACLRSVDLPELFGWAAENGFGALEVWGANFRDRDDLFVGGMLNVSRMTAKSAREVLAWSEETGVEISCITQCTNMLDPKADVRRQRTADFKQVIAAAGFLGVRNVSGFVGRG